MVSLLLVCLPVCLCVVCLFVCRSVCLSVCLSVWFGTYRQPKLLSGIRILKMSYSSKGWHDWNSHDAQTLERKCCRRCVIRKITLTTTNKAARSTTKTTQSTAITATLPRSLQLLQRRAAPRLTILTAFLNTVADQIVVFDCGSRLETDTHPAPGFSSDVLISKNILSVCSLAFSLVCLQLATYGCRSGAVFGCGRAQFGSRETPKVVILCWSTVVCHAGNYFHIVLVGTVSWMCCSFKRNAICGRLVNVLTIRNRKKTEQRLWHSRRETDNMHHQQ